MELTVTSPLKNGLAQGQLEETKVTDQTKPALIRAIAEFFLQTLGYEGVYEIDAVTWKGAEHQFWQVTLKNPNDEKHTGVVNVHTSGKVELVDHALAPPPPAAPAKK
jgi:hypothetical protein